ncbi:hypothetical protein [Kineococcus radiotolerans]|uniref:Uncharacterized protein n=1 Tax=Kineococcus radiotolerans (strain ATCC BAA-149 / DSM 14245 / SRS30216) TaxID=266940 RepID=A6WH31_KINRD|nr:hypothetical protein [Kineococcus radiotolerans]ABS06120.1 hypothetical protein Krad_4661 [Kineococcus radiotolerans SRS30216 = ATCC BAA-149]
MSLFDRRGRGERANPPASTSTSAGGAAARTGLASEPGSFFLAYLCPVGEALTPRTPFVKLRVNAKDMTDLVTRSCGAPPLTALDELSGCFYDIRFIPGSESSQLVACATFSRRNEI